VTIRRLNYTARQRLDRGAIQLSLADPDERPARVRAAVRLPQGLPAHARIHLEAHQRTTRMRFDFGTVERPGFAEGFAVLSEFDDPNAVLFALKVTAAHGEHAGLLLADRDGMRIDAADADEDRESLLPVAPGELGEDVWRLDFGSAGPMLMFNRTITDWRSFAVENRVRSLIYPAVLRQVLTRILIIDDWVDLEDKDDWRTKWLVFAHSFEGAGDLPEAPNIADKQGWIDDAVMAFSTRARFMTRLAADSEV
jgi:hypothetical protein